MPLSNEDKNDNDIDKAYDERFKDIANHKTNSTSNENAKNNPDLVGMDNSTSPGAVKKSEQGAESSNPRSVPDDSEGSLYKSSAKPKGNKWVRGQLQNRTKTGGLLALAITGIAIIIFGTIGSAPLKYIHFAEWLHGIHFSDQDTVSAKRVSNLIFYARVPLDGLDGLEKTRIGYYHTKIANKVEARMLTNGLRAEYNKGTFTHISFDSSKVKADSKYSDLKDLKDEDLKKELSKRFNVDQADIKGSGGKFEIKAEGAKANRRLMSTATKADAPDIPFGRAVSSLSARSLIKKANLSLNPLTRVKGDLKQSAADKYKDWYDKRRAKFTGESIDLSKNKIRDPDSPPENPAQQELDNARNEGNKATTDKSKLKGIGKAAGPLAVLAVMCAIKDGSDQIGKINYSNKIGATIQASSEILGLGSKIKEGFDKNTGEAIVDLETLGELDKMYGNYAAAPSYQYLNGEDTGDPLFKDKYPEFNPDNQGVIDKTDEFFKKVESTDGIGPLVNGACGAFTFFGNISSSIVGALTLGASEAIEEFFIGGLLNFLATDVADPTEEKYQGTPVGGELANVGSREVASESFIAMGARPVNTAEAQAMRQETIAYENNNDERNLAAKLVDFKDIDSPLSKAYASLNINLAKNGNLGYATYLASSFGSVFSQSTNAASDEDVEYFYGIPKTGFNPSKLDKIENPYKNASWVANNLTIDSEAVKHFQECTKMVVNADWSFEPLPFPEGLVNYDDLPGYCLNDNDEGLYRLRVLALDTANMTSYACLYEEDQEACGSFLNAGDEWTSDNTGGVAINVATFNVLGAQHTAKDGKLESWPSGKNRMSDAFDIIQQNRFEVVGFQELEEEQRQQFVNRAGNEWGIHPDKPVYGNDFRSQNSIVWKTSVFELIEPGGKGYQDDLKYLGDYNYDAPWVRLRHKQSGQVVYIKNVHDPLTINDNNAAQWRYENALKHRADALEKIDNGEKVILLGDFNSAEYVRVADQELARDELTYCVLTKGEKLLNAYDAVKNKTGKCPTKSASDFGIDHIYTSPDIGVQKWSQVTGLNVRQISDHPMVFSTLVIGNSETVGAEGWTWPVKGSPSISSCFAQPLSKGPHPGLDVQAGTGTPLYAVANGTVYGNPGGSYGILTIKHKTESGETVYSIYEHMSRFDVGKDAQVTAGQQVGLSGNTAPPGGSSGPHLHFGITKDPSVFAYADMGKGQIYNPLVFINDDQSYKQCSNRPQIR